MECIQSIERRNVKIRFKNVKKHTIDTAAIRAIRWKGHGVSDTGKFTLMYSGNDSNTFGTSLLINKTYKKAITYFEVVDESLCSLRTRRAFNNFTIISVQRLTKEKDGLINDSLHKKLNQIYKRIPTFVLKLKWVILMPKYQNRKTRSLHTNYRQMEPAWDIKRK